MGDRKDVIRLILFFSRVVLIVGRTAFLGRLRSGMLFLNVEQETEGMCSILQTSIALGVFFLISRGPLAVQYTLHSPDPVIFTHRK